jgi:hypothetical protein
MVINHGATSSVDAMTEPRPRLTNTIGNVQQTSVVRDEASPNIVRMRGRIEVLLVRAWTCRETTVRQQREEIRSGVRRDGDAGDREGG